MKPYSELANAIILRAIDDYRLALEQLDYLLKTSKYNAKPIVETKIKIDKFEEFFRSEWYDAMTDISGEDVIRKIRKEAEQ